MTIQKQQHRWGIFCVKKLKTYLDRRMTIIGWIDQLYIDKLFWLFFHNLRVIKQTTIPKLRVKYIGSTCCYKKKLKLIWLNFWIFYRVAFDCLIK